MNGLTAESVELIIDAIKEASTELLKEKQFRAAKELQSVCEVIEQMQRDNTTQPSRPDRVGDECWYGTWERGIGWQWRRGILRAWVPGDWPAVVEDVEAKKVECYSMISFSEEVPA
jgi:hypothetical protein